MDKILVYRFVINNLRGGTINCFCKGKSRSNKKYIYIKKLIQRSNLKLLIKFDEAVEILDQI